MVNTLSMMLVMLMMIKHYYHSDYVNNDCDGNDNSKLIIIREKIILTKEMATYFL